MPGTAVIQVKFKGVKMENAYSKKYYFYWYNLFGAPASGKRYAEIADHSKVIEEVEITEAEYHDMNLGQLAAKYPCSKIPDLT